MRTIRLAWALIRIPHLAITLFFFPLVLSLGMVAVQLAATAVVLNTGTGTAAKEETEEKPTGEFSVARFVLYGDGKIRPPLKVCRWIYNTALSSEFPPNDACQPDRLDVALKVSNPATIDSSAYEAAFSGMIDRLHICQSCEPDIVISPEPSSRPTSKVSSAFGLAVIFLPYEGRNLQSHRMNYHSKLRDVKKLIGDLSFVLPEIPEGIALSELQTAIPVTLNITFLVVIALWLGLRAHRKVLDYFSFNNVLMPLVAACGKRRFYGAIWVLTLLRVICFLGASVPLVYFGLQQFSDSKAFSSLGASKSQIILWLITLISSMALATILASVGELKHRHNFLSFAYRFVPIGLALIGSTIWATSFLFNGQLAPVVRSLVTVLPILGMAPVFVAPILNVPFYMLLIHAISSVFIIAVALKKNARWFAAHLEEI